MLSRNMSCLCKLESFPWILSHFCAVILGHPVRDTELYSSHGCITKISYVAFVQRLVDDSEEYVTVATGQGS